RRRSNGRPEAAGVPAAAARHGMRLPTAMLERMPALYVADRDGVLLYANPAYAALAERAVEAPGGQPPAELFSHAEIVAEIESGGEPAIRELSLGTPPLSLRVRFSGIYDGAARGTPSALADPRAARGFDAACLGLDLGGRRQPRRHLCLAAPLGGPRL